jgi:CHAT domain-containing protein/tetratricopeptide (TPR) repeat protein
LWEDLNEPAAIARTYLEQGDAALAVEDRLEARGAYERALQICESLADFRCAAEAANNSGYTASLLGDLEASGKRLREAAEDLGRISKPLFQGKTLSNLGLMLWQSGDFDQAIEVMEKARQILRGRDATAHAQVLNNMGLYYQSLSENEKALAYFQSALTVFLAQHEAHHAVRCRLNVGRAYMLLGRLERAQTALEQALDQATRISDSSARGDVLNNLGQVLLRLHRGNQARASLTEALSLQRQVRSKRGEAIALHYLGIEAGQRGDTEDARRSLTAAARIRRETGLRDDASESVFALAELEFRAGNFPAAQDLAAQAISLIESLRSKVPSAALRATYYARKRRFFDLLTEIAMAPSDPNRTTGAVTAGLLASEQARGRALLDLLTAGTVGGGIPADLLDRRTGLRRQIDAFSVRLSDPESPRQSETARARQERERQDLRRRIELLLGENDQVEAEIRQAVHATALGRPLSSVADVQAALPEDSALLEYYLGERESYLWVVQPGGVQAFRLPARQDIETLALRAVNRFGDILGRRRSPPAQAAFQADLRRLSAMLLDPLAQVHLPPRLILVLDGVLNRVPMAALRLPGTREALGLRFDLIRAPSAAYLLAAKPPLPISAYPRSVLAIADPVFGADDPRLTAAPTSAARTASLPRLFFTGEVTALKSLLPPARLRILEGFDATPAALQKLNAGDFAVLHFSTHAFIDDRIPELSRVALSLVDRAGRPVDGYLHPYQFAGLRLNRSIVALSSCETALGKEVIGEGLAGFTTGLFEAGASQVVLSLTKVDAESSAAFFAETYRRFLATPSPGMESAITQARRALAGSTRWADPYYWAPFVVIGSPSWLTPRGMKALPAAAYNGSDPVYGYSQ